MSGNLPEFSALSQRCQEHLAEITDSLNACFEQHWQLEAGESVLWAEAQDIAERLASAGVVVSCIFAEQGGYLLALPESLPLPAWASQPDIEQQARLQTLALAWQAAIVPEESQDCITHAQPTHDLATVIQWASPLAAAQVLPLYVEIESALESVPGAEDAKLSPEADGDEKAADAPLAAESADSPPESSAADIEETGNLPESGPDGETPADPAESPEIPESLATRSPGRVAVYLIGPVETPPAQLEVESLTSAGFDDADLDTAEDDFLPFGETYHGVNQDSVELLERIRRLLPLKVPVSVRLAEMKIEMSSLINLSPGMLLVFPKSCDDLLDLYVNNKLYAQGEAVKIGEKFGLKINDVGIQKQRKPGVFSL